MRICFLSLNAYPTLADSKEKRVGGAEVQQKMLASYLLHRGHEVSFVTRDCERGDGCEIDGIRIYEAFKGEDGVRFLRFFHPRWTGVWYALSRTDADVYYQRCAGMETGLLAEFCRLHGRCFIFASGSDSDFKPDQLIIPSRRDRWLYFRGLRRADAIVVQTRTQRRLLRENFALEASVIPNCWAGKVGERARQLDGAPRILWVSTLRHWKRPSLFLDLAEQLPEFEFVMVGGPASGEQGLYDTIRARASSLGNVSFEGFVPFAEVGRYFDRAHLFVNTSEPKEGFPNTFLQAWQRGVPVVSYFDPDGIVAREGLGRVVATPQEMRAAVEQLCSDQAAHAACGRRAMRYFEGHHRIDIVGARYEEIFQSLAER